MLRATKTAQPIIRSRVMAAQRGLHVSRPVRQGAAGGNPTNPTPDAQRNKYMMYGAGALGIGAIFYYMTGKPEQAKNVSKTNT
ncbi:hypothetical protein BGZ63DRAFT_422989 [Mariannaea sp. PMI_226]|nr:hypothetical protein BGZ63DRAFT_422989 [Mariannaea sp. PMI_226]